MRKSITIEMLSRTKWHVWAYYTLLYWAVYLCLWISGVTDFWTPLYFYIFLAGFVYPLGHMAYGLFLGARLPLDEFFLPPLKILMAIPVLGLSCYLFGLNIPVLGVLAAASYIFLGRELLSGSRNKEPVEITNGDRKPWRVILKPFPGANLYILILAVALILLTVRRFFPYIISHDPLLMVPADGDISTYAATIQSLIKHTGSYMEGFRHALGSGFPNNPLRMFTEFFEGIFIKYSNSDSIVFHHVIFSHFQIMLLLSIIFTNPLTPDVQGKTSGLYQGAIVPGLGLLFLMSNNYILPHAYSGDHIFMAFPFVLAGMKVLTHTEHLSEERYRGPGIWLAWILFIMAATVHLILAVLFLLAFFTCFIFKGLERLRPGSSVKWFLSAAYLVLVVLILTKFHPLQFGDMKFWLQAFDQNSIVLYFLNPYEIKLNVMVKNFSTIHGALSFIAHDFKGFLKMGSYLLVMSFYYLMGLIFIYYFAAPKAGYKVFTAATLFGVLCVMLFVSYPNTYRPEALSQYMPFVVSLIAAFAIIEIFLVHDLIKVCLNNRYLHHTVIVVMTGALLVVNYSLYGYKPDISVWWPANLVEMLLYVRKQTPPDSVIMQNTKAGVLMGYFSGFAYRFTVEERGVHHYSEISRTVGQDLKEFYEGQDPCRQVELADKYQVDYVLSSPDAPVSPLPGFFDPVYDQGGYKLFRYHHPDGADPCPGKTDPAG